MSKIDQQEEKNTHIEARSEAKRPLQGIYMITPFRRKRKNIAGYMYCPFCQQNTLVNEVKVKHPKGTMRHLSCSVCNILLYADLAPDDVKQSVMLDAIEEIYEK